MRVTGQVKRADQLYPGDKVSLTGWSADASPVESVKQQEMGLQVITENGKKATVTHNKRYRLYEDY